MSIHETRIIDPMSAIEFDDSARKWARLLEDRETGRGHPLPVARQTLARRIGVSAGTLENLRRGRIKGVRAFVFEKIRLAYLAELQRQKELLRHEIAIAQAKGWASPSLVASVADALGEVD